MLLPELKALEERAAEPDAALVQVDATELLLLGDTAAVLLREPRCDADATALAEAGGEREADAEA